VEVSKYAELVAVANGAGLSVLNVNAMADAAPGIFKHRFMVRQATQSAHVLCSNLESRPSTSLMAMLCPPGFRNRQ
jgi:hypothetical protein